jgi:hypothetical protein
MPLELSFNFNYFYELAAIQDPFTLMIKVFKDGGWIVLFLFFLRYLGWEAWMTWRQAIFHSKRSFVVLALDIPKDNEQSPKAVEHIFSQLAGSLSAGNKIDRFWKGRFQESFSFEIVSNGGYIQFYIHTQDVFRDLVEAAVYAQYPNAIITEVEDYTQPYKNLRFPNPDFKLWGTEMQFVRSNAYPIRTYPMFEHSLSQELKDPMASLLEIMSRLSPGEQVWLQFLATPISGSWAKEGGDAIKKMLGGSSSSKNLVDKIGDLPMGILNFIDTAIFPEKMEFGKKEEKKSKSMMELTPGEKTVIEAIQNKTSKLGFKVSFRFIYFGLNNVYSKQRGVSGVMGALNQFNTIDLNAFKPDPRRKTQVDYWFTKTRDNMRKNILRSKYVSRDTDGTRIILNTEELASLYHFPVMLIKPALLSTVSAKRMEAPDSLPINLFPRGSLSVEAVEANQIQENKDDALINALNQVEQGWGQENIAQKTEPAKIKEAKKEVTEKIEPPMNLPI